MPLSRLIRSSAEKKPIFNGKAIHARLIISGSDPDVQIHNHLLTMYAKLGHIDYAQKLFNKMLVRNLVTWTTLISAYSQVGLSEKALNCFRLMVLDDGITPNDYTYVSAISACAQCGENEEGLRIFLRSLRMGVKVNEFSYGSVLGACAALEMLEVGRQVQCLALKCGIKMDAGSEEADNPNVAAVTALIGGFCAAREMQRSD
ncbi:Pentatricopeptide repeat-containing protein, mitochondrial [Sesamum alatum]|uniref:Pentatricopeptide repeat-containing protein, mitochondrial n=1 Tax=Sesamum alatum TaxID=300844 RepID=A0AAE1YSZ8_9LAMI|nr:Pentatricopeptide repeat-containing protein, mitochondrial [Sesamum alatum]